MSDEIRELTLAELDEVAGGVNVGVGIGQVQVGGAQASVGQTNIGVGFGKVNDSEINFLNTYY